MCKGAHNEEDEQTIKLRKWVNLAFTFLANAIWNRGPYVTDTINGFRAVRADSPAPLRLPRRRLRHRVP